jgi:transcriptional regulator with XRE-family HTH domain
MPDIQPFYAQVGKRIRTVREERGLTQEALASLVNLTRTSITNIEKGRQKLMLHTFVAVAAALRISPAALLPETAATSDDAVEAMLRNLPIEEKDWIRTALKAVMEE